MTLDPENLAGILSALLLVGAILKHAVGFPTKYIPLLLLVGGELCWLAMTRGWSDPAQWLAGLIAVASAIGVHSGVKNSFEKKGDQL